MKVRELIEALKECPNLDVTVSAYNKDDNNEFNIHVVSCSRIYNSLVLSADASEIGGAERILHDDNPPEPTPEEIAADRYWDRVDEGRQRAKDGER